jgi:hypothetical protein
MTDYDKYKKSVGHFIAYRTGSRYSRTQNLINLVYYMIRTYGVSSEYNQGLYLKISNEDKENNTNPEYWLCASDICELLYSDSYTNISEEQKLNRQKIMEA